MAQSINEHVIRWSEIRLPDPARPGQLASWPIDGPFAVRKYYRVDGSAETVELKHLEKRREDGTLCGCMHCGHNTLEKSSDVKWMPIVIWALIGLALAWFTFGISLLLAAYPIWFLWSASPRTETCTSCKAEFVNFCHGPRP